MKHYGNVTKINGAGIEPVDIITFGSPCQDLSVAGKRAGIQDGERSNLFFEAVRIIKEMRDATNNEYPKYAVWENVPGAFSSNKGRDFHAVLEAFCSVCDDTVSIPKPYDAKRANQLVWRGAGEIVGDNYSVAWRTLDAQYWGVPQRRKRIYLVADFTGQRAGEILFKPDSLRRDFTQGNEAGQGATADAVGSVDGSVRVECVGFDMYNQSSTGDKTRTLKTPAGGDDLPVIVLNDQGGSSINIESEEISPTLRANSHQHEPVIALQANGIDRADTAGCNGAGWRENESYTLNTVDRHAVCYPLNEQIILRHGALGKNTGFGAGADGDPAYTLQANHPHAVCYENHQHGGYREGCGTLRASGGDYGGGSENVIVAKTKPPRKYIIRRLTPTECARLQGFPDKWGHLAPYNPADAEFWENVRKTHAEINGKKYKPTKNLKKWYEGLHTDSAEYKMWGNGIALPNARYVMQGIAEQGAKTLGSLFDGSGGFPLAGLLNGIKPVWASEIEPYPIAVTKSRFGEVQNERNIIHRQRF